jgi:calcineurin-like phosphoesterase family protein
LCQRLSTHRSNYRNYLKGIYNNVTSFEIIKHDDYEIILIEDYPCNSKEELNRRERYFIESIVCVNKHHPGRTQKEYHIDNREMCAAKAKKYYARNIVKLKARHDCECGGHYRYDSKHNHLKSKSHVYQVHG